MCAMRLTGYADKFSVHPGDKIKFYVNCDGPKKYSASIVQMINGDTNPRGPGFIEKAVKADCEGVYDGIKQVVYGGSSIPTAAPNCASTARPIRPVRRCATTPGTSSLPASTRRPARWCCITSRRWSMRWTPKSRR